MSNLHVVALVSGGKDSLFSLLHCAAHGHTVVALANVYKGTEAGATAEAQSSHGTDGPEELGDTTEDDADSHMYQTVGHGMVPLIAEALCLPLYRQALVGTAMHSDAVYDAAGTDADEVEVMTRLLQEVKRHHPQVNAVSSGAILSTYQRTRVESVAARIGLVPLAFLWQFPRLPPYTQSSLLADMAAAGCDHRIIKVASGGLDSRHLWQNVADATFAAKLAKDLARFSDRDAVGAVLGEGGEYETLAVDGPAPLWKKRLVFDSHGIDEPGGGVATVAIRAAHLVDKGSAPVHAIRIPPLLDDHFAAIQQLVLEFPLPETIKSPDQQLAQKMQALTESVMARDSVVYISNISSQSGTTAEQMTAISNRLKHALFEHGLEPADITHTTILLRRMGDFAAVNAVYGSLFTKPSPAARATVAVGALPHGVDVAAFFVAHRCRLGQRRALHVQSRSYWAPANIGPYSQAVAVPAAGGSVDAVYIAGQIPLVPATMELVPGGFVEQATLSLQHLWRIGREMGVHVWQDCIAYITADSAEQAQYRARVASGVWAATHLPAPSDDEDESEDADYDVGDRMLHRAWHSAARGDIDKTPMPPLPDYTKFQGSKTDAAPHCVVVQVHELPRAAAVEWSATGLRSNGQFIEAEQGQAASGLADSVQELSQLVKRANELWAVPAAGVEVFAAGSQSLPPGVTAIPCYRVIDGTGRQRPFGFRIRR